MSTTNSMSTSGSADSDRAGGGPGPAGAMIWKELRENAKWAALALVGLGAAMAYGVHRMCAGVQPVDLSLAMGLLAPVSILGMPAAALLLGLMQTLPERRPDRWAFLVHRPVTRRWLFACKAAAGLGLYLLAAGLPLLGSCLWLAAPGHWPAPFDWRLALPTLADWCAGVAWYFAGMLLGLRRARWYASRLPAVGAAVVGSFAVVVVPEFWQALLVAAVAAAVTGTAAWGAFSADGPGAVPRPRPARAALDVTLFCGFLIAAGAAFAFLNSVFLEHHGPGRPFTNYYLTADGRPVRVTQQGLTITSVTDPAGGPVDEYKDVTDATQLSRIVGSGPGPQLVIDPSDRRRDTYRSGSRYLVNAGESGAPANPASWYLVPDKGELVGYDVRTAARIGAIGPGGFAPDGRDVTPPFAGDLLANQPKWYAGPLPLLAFPSALYRPLYDQHKVEALFTAPAGETLLDAAVLQIPAPDAAPAAPGEWSWVAATDKAIYVVPPPPPAAERAPSTTAAPPAPSGPVRIPLAHDLRQYGLVQVKPVAGGGYAVRYQPLSAMREGRDAPEYVDQVAADGTVRREEQLPPLPQPASSDPAALGVLAGLVAPVAAVVGGGLWLVQRTGTPLRTVLSDPSAAAALYTCLLVAAACGVVAYSLARRYAFRPAGRWGWAAGSFLLGPAALLTLLSTHPWPARERCPGCGRKRVVTREHCEHCGAPFNPPAADGTEILVG